MDQLTEQNVPGGQYVGKGSVFGPGVHVGECRMRLGAVGPVSGRDM